AAAIAGDRYAVIGIEDRVQLDMPAARISRDRRWLYLDRRPRGRVGALVAGHVDAHAADRPGDGRGVDHRDAGIFRDEAPGAILATGAGRLIYDPNAIPIGADQGHRE